MTMQTKNDVLKQLGRISKKYFSSKTPHVEGEEKVGLGRSQGNILDYLVNNAGYTQDEIAKALKLDKSSVARATKRLEDLGLLRKEQSQEDGRQYHLYIEDKGVEQLNTLNAFFDERSEKVLEDISDEELDTLKNILDKIESNIEKYRLVSKDEDDHGHGHGHRYGKKREGGCEDEDDHDHGAGKKGHGKSGKEDHTHEKDHGHGKKGQGKRGGRGGHGGRGKGNH